MFFRSLARASTSFSAFAGVAGVAFAVLTAPAHAAPPSFTGQPVTIPLPQLGEFNVVNLRQQGVIAGSAPMTIATGQGIVFIGGQPSGVLSVTPVSSGSGSPGAVCVALSNEDFTPTTAPIQFDLFVQNAEGTVNQRIALVLGAAPTVDVQDPLQLAQCDDPNQAPTADAGPDQTLVDSDGAAGENVTLSGNGSDPEGDALTFQWFAGARVPLATGQNPVVRLPDGVTIVTLEVNDGSGAIGSDTVAITVAAPAVPTANAGPDRNIPDSDGEPGENVTLDGSASTDSDGSIVSYEWSRSISPDEFEVLGTGTSPTLNVRLPDGANDILLVVTDNTGIVASDTVTITVATAPLDVVLSELANLTPNQRRMANKVDGMCDALAQLAANDVTLSPDQLDLLAKCNGLRSTANSTANQIDALEELIPDDFSVARTQTLLFANTQYASIMDRLIALRGGARGLSLAGLNVIVDGKMVPLAELQDMVGKFFGGGAAADEPGGLLSDKWGLWARGNFSFGEKDASASSPAFDADQWAFVGGIDYRVSDKSVLGAALSYGSSEVEFAADDGALNTDSFALSLYGSAYAAKNFYFDGIVNVSNSSYDAERNIVYVDGTGLVTADAAGDTDGMTLSGGLSAGYDFLVGGLTISPNLGFFYIDTTIDGFTESGAGGLNLIYDEQKFKSLTGNAGLRLTYAWNLSWGVLLPHLRADYVREFEDDVDVFGVRFANDPNAASTPPVLVATDNPDQSYWRLAGGFSAQFKHGVSGYIEYQRLESFQFISLEDISIGLRFQRSF
jgi:outer membrane autotransporter protein